MTISVARIRTGPSASARLKGRIPELKAGDIMASVTVIMPSNYAGLWKRRELAQTGYANVRSVVVDRVVQPLGAPL